MVGQANIINKFANVRMEDLRGMRVPFLRVGWNRQFLMMKEFGFVYDSSMVAPFSNIPLWPYTLDFKMPHTCTGNNQVTIIHIQSIALPPSNVKAKEKNLNFTFNLCSSIARQEVIQVFGRWWWINWNTVNTIAVWLTRVHRISMARKSIACWRTISNGTIQAIEHRTASISTQPGSKRPSIKRHSCDSWTIWPKCRTYTLSPIIRPFNGCASQHRSIPSTRSSRGTAKASNSNRVKWPVIYRIRVSCAAEYCNKIDTLTHAMNVRLNIHGYEMNLA